MPLPVGKHGALRHEALFKEAPQRDRQFARNRNDHDPSTTRPDEQPVKPPRSSCSTQTYKVPSEGGGEASINMVRCFGQ